MIDLLREWSRKDAPTLAHVLKILLASLLSLWVSLLFDIDQPRTAMITVAIVMQAHSGMVLAKSYYRMIGTAAGIAASLLLVALFAQERIPFLVCMAIWIGLCTAGSVIFRNHQSYAFVLAGYTLCIVGLPATLHPGSAFEIAMDRISGIAIGLLCATLVSDLVFPKRIGGVMLDSVRRRFADFSGLIRASSMGESNQKEQLMRLTGDVFSLEAFRASSVLESDESRSHRLRLGRMNAEFMEASTTLHSLGELLRRQRRGGFHATADALEGIFRELGSALLLEGRPAEMEKEAARAAAQIANFRENLAGSVSAARSHADPDKTGFDAGAQLLARLAEELHAYSRTYASLSRKRNEVDAPALGVRFDPLAVSLAGARGALMLAIMSMIWILTEWDSGIEAITLGVISSTLFATSPAPARTIGQFLTGASIGAALAFWMNFFVLDRAHGFPMLCLALSPGLALAGWLSAKPERAVTGAGTFIVLLMHLGFGNRYGANPAAFANDVIADFIAILFSGLLYSLIDLSGSGWSRRRTSSALRALVAEACREPLGLRREKLEIGARDLVQRAGSMRRIADPEDRIVVEWLFSTLEIGHAAIALREDAGDSTAGVLDALASLFDSPSGARREAAIRAIEEAEQGLQAENRKEKKLKIHLHLLKTALLDGESVIARNNP